MKKYILMLFIAGVALNACDHKQQNKQTTTPENTAIAPNTEQTPPVEDKENKPSAEELREYFQRDNSSGRTIIQPRDISDKGDGMYCYFHLKNNRASGMRLHIQYWGGQFANASQYRLEADGKSHTYTANKSSSGSGNAQIVESAIFYWFDNSVNKSDLEFLKAFSEAHEASITLLNRDGSKLGTIRFTNAQKLSLKRTVDYYFALDGTDIPEKGMVNIRG